MGESEAIIGKRETMPKASPLGMSPFSPIVSLITLTAILNSVLLLTVRKYMLNDVEDYTQWLLQSFTDT